MHLQSIGGPFIVRSDSASGWKSIKLSAEPQKLGIFFFFLPLIYVKKTVTRSWEILSWFFRTMWVRPTPLFHRARRQSKSTAWTEQIENAKPIVYCYFFVLFARQDHDWHVFIMSVSRCHPVRILQVEILLSSLWTKSRLVPEPNERNRTTMSPAGG